MIEVVANLKFYKEVAHEPLRPTVLKDPRTHISHWVLRPNRMLIVCVPRNQVYTHTIQKIDIE
jgi:hypothetical protein